MLSPGPRKGLRTAVVSFVLGSQLKCLGLSPVRFYDLFPYMSEVRVLGARRGEFLLWSRGV